MIALADKVRAGAPPFTASKRELLAKIESIQYTQGSSPSAMRQQAALSYYMGALQDMPGGKFLLIISAETRIPGQQLENRIWLNNCLWAASSHFTFSNPNHGDNQARALRLSGSQPMRGRGRSRRAEYSARAGRLPGLRQPSHKARSVR